MKVEHYLKHFRLVARQRNECNAAGLSDNGGAIHAAERVLQILCLNLCYPGIGHQNKLRDYPDAMFSEAALEGYLSGVNPQIEHVAPHRALTRAAIAFIDAGATDEDFKDFLKKHYQIVLLTKDERSRLDKLNRSTMEADRLSRIGVRLVHRSSAVMQ